MPLREALAEKLLAAYPKSHEGTVRRKIATLIDDAEQRLGEAEVRNQVKSWIVQFPRRDDDWITADAALADLRHLLIGPISGWAKIWRKLRAFAAFASANFVPFLASITAVSGAFYGLAYARFYDHLDITPDQVGLTPAQLLTRSLVGGLVLVFLFTLALVCVFVPLIPMKDEKAARSERGSWRGVLLNAGLTAAGGAGLVLLTVLAGLTVSSVAVFIVLSVIMFAAVSLELRRDGRRLRLRPSPLDFSLDRYGVVTTACTIPALVFAVLATFAVAEDLGESASVGKAVRDPKIGIFPILGVRAEPAFVDVRNAGRLPSPPRCVLYLGTSNDKVILYDDHSSSTFHIPAADVSMRIQSEMSSCEAPINVQRPLTLPYGEGKLRCTHGRWRSRISTVRYRYQWMWEGHPAQDDGKGRPWLLYERGFPRESAVYCRVTAITPLGEDAALSRPAVVRPRPSPERSEGLEAARRLRPAGGQ